MARLPDGSAFGALPSALSNRPIATYDVSGYARGAAALGEGVSDLGKGILRAANEFEDQRSKSARVKLDQAKADGAYLLAKTQLRAALADESDPDAVIKTYPEQFRSAFAEAGSLIGDPQAREVWSQARSGSRDAEVAASLDHAETLHREREVAGVTAQLDALRQSAHEMPDEVDRAAIIGIGRGLISGLHNAGLVDETQVKALREGWTADYAEAQLGKRPPEERMKLLSQGQGTIAEFIQEDRRVAILQAAQAEALGAQRKVQSDTALAQYTTRQTIDEDIKQIQATGRGRNDLTPLQIDATLGPEARRAWQAQRDDARTIWTLTHDLSTLTDEEIDNRVTSATPKGDDATNSGDTPTVSTRQQAIYDQVSERAAKLRELRRTDPAASVADDPNVRVAAEEFDPQRPETARAMIDARVSAQKRAGIEAPAITTRIEATELLRPLVAAAKDNVEARGGNLDSFEHAQREFVARIETIYGSRAEAVMQELAAQIGLRDLPDVSSGDSSQEHADTSNLFVPIQFRIWRNSGVPSPALPLTPGQQKEAYEFIKSIPSAANRNLAYAGLMAEVFAWIFRDVVLNQSKDNSDKRPNTEDPDKLVERPDAGSSTPPEREPPRQSGPLGSAIAAGALITGIAKEEQKRRERKDTESFLNDVSEQRRFMADWLKDDFDRAMTRIQGEINRQSLIVSPYAMAGLWYYSGGQDYLRLNAQYAAGRPNQSDRKLVALIEKGIAELPINTQTIYRSPVRTIEQADEIFNEASVGKVLSMPNHLQSYTLNAWRAALVSRKSDVILRIKSPTKGAVIEAFSQFPTVREVLLPTGLRYKVISKDDIIGAQGREFRVIDLEVLQ